MITNYQELPIREEMKKAIAEMGFTEMTEIQQKAIPELLAGKEVIAKAPTGTGKTCAFGVPMVQRIQPEKGYVQGVILCPRPSDGPYAPAQCRHRPHRDDRAG